MFEKEDFEKYMKDSEDYYDNREPMTERKLYQLWKDGAEFGYKEGIKTLDDMTRAFNREHRKYTELRIANEWHEDLPTTDISLAIIEVEDCGYLLCEYRKGVWYDSGSSSVCKDWITRNIKRWKEIVLPELKESE